MTLFGNSVTYNKKAQFLLEGTINLDQGSIEVKKLAAGASREVYAVHGSHCVVKLEVQCPLQATKDQHRRVRAFNGRAEWRRNEHELVAFQAVGADTYAPGVPAANAVQFGTFQNMSDETVPVCALFVEELAQPDLQQPFLEAAQRGDAEALNHIIRSAVATIWRAGLAGFACADMCLENLGVCRDGQIVICDMGEWKHANAQNLKHATTAFLTSCARALKPYPVNLKSFRYADGWCKPALAPPGFIEKGLRYLDGFWCQLLGPDAEADLPSVAPAVELSVQPRAAPSPTVQSSQQAPCAPVIMSLASSPPISQKPQLSAKLERVTRPALVSAKPREAPELEETASRQSNGSNWRPTRRHCISGCGYLGTQFDDVAREHRCCKMCQVSSGKVHGRYCESQLIDARHRPAPDAEPSISHRVSAVPKINGAEDTSRCPLRPRVAEEGSPTVAAPERRRHAPPAVPAEANAKTFQANAQAMLAAVPGVSACAPEEARPEASQPSSDRQSLWWNAALALEASGGKLEAKGRTVDSSEKQGVAGPPLAAQSGRASSCGALPRLSAKPSLAAPESRRASSRSALPRLRARAAKALSGGGRSTATAGARERHQQEWRVYLNAVSQQAVDVGGGGQAVAQSHFGARGDRDSSRETEPKAKAGAASVLRLGSTLGSQREAGTTAKSAPAKPTPFKARCTVSPPPGDWAESPRCPSAITNDIYQRSERTRSAAPRGEGVSRSSCLPSGDQMTSTLPALHWRPSPPTLGGGALRAVGAKESTRPARRRRRSPSSGSRGERSVLCLTSMAERSEVAVVPTVAVTARGAATGWDPLLPKEATSGSPGVPPSKRRRRGGAVTPQADKGQLVVANDHIVEEQLYLRSLSFIGTRF